MQAQNAANGFNRSQTLTNSSRNQLASNPQTGQFDADVVSQYNAGSQAYFFKGVPITTVLAPEIFPAILPASSAPATVQVATAAIQNFLATNSTADIQALVATTGPVASALVLRTVLKTVTNPQQRGAATASIISALNPGTTPIVVPVTSPADITTLINTLDSVSTPPPDPTIPVYLVVPVFTKGSSPYTATIDLASAYQGTTYATILFQNTATLLFEYPVSVSGVSEYQFTLTYLGNSITVIYDGTKLININNRTDTYTANSTIYLGSLGIKLNGLGSLASGSSAPVPSSPTMRSLTLDTHTGDVIIAFSPSTPPSAGFLEAIGAASNTDPITNYAWYSPQIENSKIFPFNPVFVPNQFAYTILNPPYVGDFNVGLVALTQSGNQSAYSGYTMSVFQQLFLPGPPTITKVVTNIVWPFTTSTVTIIPPTVLGNSPIIGYGYTADDTGSLMGGFPLQTPNVLTLELPRYYDTTISITPVSPGNPNPPPNPSESIPNYIRKITITPVVAHNSRTGSTSNTYIFAGIPMINSITTDYGKLTVIYSPVPPSFVSSSPIVNYKYYIYNDRQFITSGVVDKNVNSFEVTNLSIYVLQYTVYLQAITQDGGSGYYASATSDILPATITSYKINTQNANIFVNNDGQATITFKLATPTLLVPDISYAISIDNGNTFTELRPNSTTDGPLVYNPTTNSNIYIKYTYTPPGSIYIRYIGFATTDRIILRSLFLYNGTLSNIDTTQYLINSPIINSIKKVTDSTYIPQLCIIQLTPGNVVLSSPVTNYIIGIQQVDSYFYVFRSVDVSNSTIKITSNSKAINAIIIVAVDQNGNTSITSKYLYSLQDIPTTVQTPIIYPPGISITV